MAEPLRIDWATNDKDVIAAFKRQQAEMEKERKARQELQKQINSNAAADREAKKAAIDAARATSAEQKRLADDAAKIAVAVRTPLQTFKAGLKDLQGHLQSGRLSNDQYRAAVNQLKNAYDEASGKAERSRKALAAETAEKKEAEAITAKLLTREEQYSLKLKRLNELRDKGRLTADQHAKAVAKEKAGMQAAAPQAATFGQRMNEVAAGVLGANAAMAAGQKVVAVLREEYDRLIERQNKAGAVQISLAAAQENALSNLDQSMTPEAFLETMRATSQDLGMSEKDLTNAAASALSAKGNKSADEAIQAVIAAAKFKRFASSDEQAGLAGTALDLGKSFNMSPEQSLGYLAQVQKTARVVSSKGMSENIAPAIIGAGQYGVDPTTAAAIAASLTSTSVDTTGAMTNTTMSSLFSQLRSFDPGEDIGKTLRAVQHNAPLRDDFLKRARFEKRMQAPVESLLSGDMNNPGYAQFHNAQTMMHVADYQKSYDEELKKKEASPAIRAALIDQRLASGVEQIQLSDPRQGVSGIIRQRLAETRDALGQSGVASRVTGMIDDFASGGLQTPDTVVAALEQERRRLTAPQVAPSFGVVSNQFSQQQSPQQKELERLLQMQIEQFKRVADAMEQDREQRQNNRQAGVAANRMALQGEAQ